MKITSLEQSIFTHGRIQIVTPEPDDEPVHFEINRHTHQNFSGIEPPKLAEHELGEVIRKKTGQEVLNSIPVRVIFDSAEHNVMARYEAWSEATDDMPVCIGNGETASVLNPGKGTRTSHVCKGPQLCRMALKNGLKCSITTRMPVLIEDKRFELRTSSTHTYRALMGQLREMQAQYGGLRHLHLNLTVWEKSMRASNYKRFGCATIELSKDSQEPFMPRVRCQSLEAYGESLLQAWKAEALPQESDMREEESLVLDLPVMAAKGAVHLRSAQEDANLTQNRDETADSRMATLFQGPFMASQEQSAAQMI